MTTLDPLLELTRDCPDDVDIKLVQRGPCGPFKLVVERKLSYKPPVQGFLGRKASH
jgi:hypothetical protein